MVGESCNVANAAEMAAEMEKSGDGLVGESCNVANSAEIAAEMEKSGDGLLLLSHAAEVTEKLEEKQQGWSTIKELKRVNQILIKGNSLTSKIRRVIKNPKGEEEGQRAKLMSFYDVVGVWYGNKHQLKDNMVELTIEVCSIIVDLIYLMSQNKRQELQMKLDVIKETLGWVGNGNHTAVIRRVQSVIRYVVSELKLCDALMLDRDYLQESFIDLFLGKLMKRILEIELFWMDERLACEKDRKLSRVTLTSLEDEVAKLSVAELREEMDQAVQHGRFGVISDIKQIERYGLAHSFLRSECQKMYYVHPSQRGFFL